jgi:hypothetical protein
LPSIRSISTGASRFAGETEAPRPHCVSCTARPDVSLAWFASQMLIEHDSEVPFMVATDGAVTGISIDVLATDLDQKDDRQTAQAEGRAALPHGP